MAGNFVELAGSESLFPTNNTNFSRSILFGYAEPFTVTGLRMLLIQCFHLLLMVIQANTVLLIVHLPGQPPAKSYKFNSYLKRNRET
jgi:hypothetical protein